MRQLFSILKYTNRNFQVFCQDKLEIDQESETDELREIGDMLPSPLKVE